MIFIQEIKKTVKKIIFWWCLNRYYWMILSWCYYKSSIWAQFRLKYIFQRLIFLPFSGFCFTLDSSFKMEYFTSNKFYKKEKIVAQGWNLNKKCKIIKIYSRNKDKKHATYINWIMKRTIYKAEAYFDQWTSALHAIGWSKFPLCKQRRHAELIQ